jgi:hypothetical protein
MASFIKLAGNGHRGIFGGFLFYFATAVQSEIKCGVEREKGRVQ